MSNSSEYTADIVRIDSLLDDPMVSLIMAVDQIDRDDARQLFCRVAATLASQTCRGADYKGCLDGLGGPRPR